MKEIKAIIRPERLHAVLSALNEIGEVPSVVVSDCRAMRDWADEGIETPKAKVEVMVSDSLAESVVAVIQAAAHTGNVGDGRIVVIPIEQTVLIRTGERGEAVR